ncbi:LuxR family transcriptional regulator [Rhodobacteraceae bacterium RKSG542]|uniref:helix-turn-helix transcriptional regulator n=1 Tax=Pseudovibrio flavus TaxID=2529854 RepID=UPI0012BB501D|nr:helix-turn-helix transcriptional regulator [Pseudovibrio flavus]MTI19112.1 LuxR family transcriptional regulator [Pseudovibrio flavus]
MDLTLSSHLDLLFKTLDRMNRGAVLVDHNLNIIARNLEAKRVLLAPNRISMASGRFELTGPDLQKELISALEAALSGKQQIEERELIIEREDEFLRPIHIEIMAQSGETVRGQLLLLITDLEIDWTMKLSRATSLFKLTTKEQDVLQELSGTKSEHQIAESLQISLNTLRSHRKNIYAKLNVSSRLELALLLHRLS